eukprot:871010-Amphidinium_carterae.1
MEGKVLEYMLQQNRPYNVRASALKAQIAMLCLSIRSAPGETATLPSSVFKSAFIVPHCYHVAEGLTAEEQALK